MPHTDRDRLAYRARLARTDPAYLARLVEADRLRDEFARHFGARQLRWSAHNVSRLLRCTGERPPRVAAMRGILGELGLGSTAVGPCPDGVFDHGDLWGRGGVPWAVVGHPYQINDHERELLAYLARFSATLRVSVDDRPGYYQAGTHHVRVELAEVLRPFDPGPSTPRTRAAARAARKAFREAFNDPAPHPEAD